MPRQLNFDLPVNTDYTRNGFVPAPGNAVALAMVADWQNWPLGKLVVSGPEGAGKTHLAHIWAGMANAPIVAARDLAGLDLEALAAAPVAVEDVPQIAQDRAAQEALFHLHNMLAAAGHALLMTGVGTPNHWHMGLPDLQSRIDAAGHAAVALPDDALLTAVLEKHFADRQLTPRADVIPYLVRRMERSFAAAQTIVAGLDATSLSERTPITRKLAASLLDNLETNG
ncbi:MAG: chromosomal replication initiator DnaA [Rhodobacteraceae bacterium]|nr:chromosomal replication initiator DnaA [Paracoccaceae bacterium]